MKSWFTSLHGAITVSILAVLAFLGYAMLSFFGYALFIYGFFIEQLIPETPGAFVITFFVLVLVGVWIWSLFSTVTGNHHWLIGAIICTALPIFFTLYDLLSDNPIPYGWPIKISIWFTFVTCLVSLVALARQLFLLNKAG